MKKIVLVNGSLRGDKASSSLFLNDLAALMPVAEFSVLRVDTKVSPASRASEDAFLTMAGAEALVLAYPLFVYSIPGGLIRFLEDFGRSRAAVGAGKGGIRLYSIVNCGYPEPDITVESRRVIRNFCLRVGFGYRFSVSIGCGPAVAMTRKVPILNAGLWHAYARIVEDVRAGGEVALDDILVKPAIPKAILLRVKESYERRSTTL